MVQRMTVCLPAGDTVQPLVQEDSTCVERLSPHTLEPVLRNQRSHRDGKPARRWTRRSPAHRKLERALLQPQRPSATKRNKL